MPSLLKKVKKRLKESGERRREERQRRELNQALLQKEVEKARWEGEKKALLEKVKKESYQKAKTRPAAGGVGFLADVGSKANKGLDFLNQDFGGVVGDLGIPDFGFGETKKKKGHSKRKKKRKK